MRSTFKKIGRRSLSIVLSLCLVAACLATTALPSNEVRAGLITNVLTGKWGAIAMGTIETDIKPLQVPAVFLPSLPTKTWQGAMSIP